MPQVAEFHSSNVEGINAGGLIFVKRDMLKSKGRLLVTLVHEYVHQITGKHGEAMLAICEQIYEEIIEDLSGTGDEECSAEPRSGSRDEVPAEFDQNLSV
jgi:hypothetical protein